jgi:predicted DNA-binding protein
MKTVQHSVRLPAALDTALRTLADRQGKTVYAMLRRCVKTGIDGQENPTVSGSCDREIVAEVASMSTRLADVERILDRTLHTACAAYCYGRSAAMGGGKTDDVIAAETQRAYDRQRAAAEGRS